MTIKQSMHDILEHEAKALLSIPYSEDYDRAIELIIEHVHLAEASSWHPAWARQGRWPST